LHRQPSHQAHRWLELLLIDRDVDRLHEVHVNRLQEVTGPLERAPATLIPGDDIVHPCRWTA
jgi:5,10-methylene-tetrahydrofolate dehydrogenase/methenyl tetrahydrofolate cyclohydrolase